MKKPKLRELVEAVKALVRGPYTSPFPAEMPEVPDAYRGAPEYHEADCVGCGACAVVCPARAITMTDDRETGKRKLTIRYDNCIYGGQCERYCITKKGVMLSRNWNQVTTDRDSLEMSVEKDLVFCEHEGCREIVGARDHLVWVAERLGPLGFANPAVMLAKLQALGLDDVVPSPEARPLSRGDRVRILCPRCRQETALEA